MPIDDDSIYVEQSKTKSFSNNYFFYSSQDVMDKSWMSNNELYILLWYICIAKKMTNGVYTQKCFSGCILLNQLDC